jgi:hypothetical protein
MVVGIDRTRAGLASFSLRFGEALRARTAEQRGRYGLLGAVPVHGGTVFRNGLGIRSVHYDAGTETVTIVLARPYPGKVLVEVHAGLTAAGGKAIPKARVVVAL